ncbi:unnamed protein product [Amoebophrya sp. A120]|nr:unnamed protein product [Amoebophrya sp. A120]|eukprot:GSA120T00005778001.1
MSTPQQQDERDDVFRRLGLATDSEFENQQKQSRSLLLRNQASVSRTSVPQPPSLRPGGAPSSSMYPPQMGAPGGGDSAASSSGYASQYQPSQQPFSVGISAPSSYQQQASSAASNYSAYQQQREQLAQAQAQQNQMLAARSKLYQQQQQQPGVHLPRQHMSSSTSAASGSDGEDADVLKRLGLCSNEEYERQSRAELTDAVRSLRNMQDRLGGGLM